MARPLVALALGILLHAPLLSSAPNASRALSITDVAAQTPPQEGGVLGFYRFPDIHGDLIVFAAEGDLWRVGTGGGIAQRLTTHPAEETDPVISPDGRTLAFTARYEGPAELYTMPLSGGLPVRHTYESEASTATTWTPRGELVYTTSHYSTLPQPQLVALDLAAGTRTRVPLHTATEATWDDSGRTLYFVRPAFHRNVTKRYTGGTARDVWKFEEGATEALELTGDYQGESHSPMWWAGRVWFVSDRDGTMNLWSMDPDGGDVRQHTRHSGWDVKEPALDAGRIVYQLGADLWIHDIVTDRSARIPIRLASDLDQLRERWVESPMEYLTSAHLHPSGESVVLTARGRVFVVPVGEGRLVQASTKQGVRYRDAVFMPDGERILVLTDQSGEFEWASVPADGIGPERALTNDATILRFDGRPSPDGRWVAYRDNNEDLWVLDTTSGSQQKVSVHREGIGDVAWSPDGRWLAYEERGLNTFVRIHLFRPDDGTRAALTSDRVNSHAMSWDPRGDFIYFLSERNLRSVVGSPWGAYQPEPFFDSPTELYHVSLRKGLRSPFSPPDELSRRESSNASAEPSTTRDRAGSASGPTPVASPVTVDLDGIGARVKKVPVPAGQYGSLAVGEGALFYVAREAGQFGGGKLMAVPIDADDPKPVEVADRVRLFQLSADRKKLLLRQGDALHVIDAKAAKAADLAEHRVDLANWSFSIDVREDWRQIFVDAWRMERDYFYDPGMHGVDWEGVRDRYLPLVERVTTRDELSDLIGRAVGELSALHTSVRGGDLREGRDDVAVASLGARLARDVPGGGYRIDYIYRSDPDYPEDRSPLADPDLGLSEGDVVESVNGTSTLDVPHIGALLRVRSGDPVRLRVRSAATGGSRDVMVTPTRDEASLRYSDWEYTRRMAVEEAGGGKIGYVHLRAMSSDDITDWYRNYYPVFNRQGLIIDVRHNRGGNIEAFVLEKLMRQAWMYWQGRVGEPYWNLHYAFRGHMVVLVDQETASDGELFAEGFRRLGLGKVIGARTWGGEIWLGSQNRLSDGGLARAPMNGVYGPEGEWLIEQVGVIPDVVVDNLPHATFNGEDAQLQEAVRHLLAEIGRDPRPVPPPPPYPNRAFRYRATDEAGTEQVRRPGGR